MNGLSTTRLVAAFAIVATLSTSTDLASRLPSLGSAVACAQPPPPGGGIRYEPHDDFAIDVSFFYEELAPYGEWIPHRRFGWVWSPYDVPLSWRPYARGRWVYSDYGWTWVSVEPFGWAVYHYGRWYFDPYYGWVWVPGTEWGPAWVDWRYGSGYIGWAPLPPDVGVWRGGRFEIGFSSSNAIRRFYWNFVPVHGFVAADVCDHIVRPSRNVNIVNITQNTTNYVQINNTIVNNSINITNIERVVGRPVQKYRVVDRARAVGGDSRTVIKQDRTGGISRLSQLARRAEVKGNEIVAFRPRVKSDKPAVTPQDVIKRIQPKQATPPSQDASKRLEIDRRALDERLSNERTKLEERSRQLQSRRPEYVKPDQVEAWKANERAALQEQEQREKKLMDRYYERMQKGQRGVTATDAPKFRVGGQQTPKVVRPPQPPGEREKEKKDKK